MADYLSKLKTKPKRTKISKALKNYIQFQEELEALVTEDKPEQYVKAITVFFEVLDFEIIDKLREFARVMAVLAKEFIKIIEKEPYSPEVLSRYKTQRVEFSNIVDIFMHNVQYVD